VTCSGRHQELTTTRLTAPKLLDGILTLADSLAAKRYFIRCLTSSSLAKQSNIIPPAVFLRRMDNTL
jgi:hypothetical protein